MRYIKQSLGRPAVFLLPLRKLKKDWRPCSGRKKVEQVVREYLLDHFGAYTAADGSIFGEWRDPKTGKVFFGKHREYSVAFVGKQRIPELEKFVATVAHAIGEECIYMTTGKNAWLVYPKPTSRFKKLAESAGLPSDIAD